MRRCTRCGWTERAHVYRFPNDPHPRWPWRNWPCLAFSLSPRDPLWIRLLARIGKGRL